MDKEATTDVVPVSSAMVHRVRSRFLEMLNNERPEDAMSRIVEQIGEAASLEQLLAGGGTTPVDDILDIPLWIHGFKAVQGDYDSNDEGAESEDNTFAIIACEGYAEGDKGRKFLVSSGSLVLKAQLVQAADKGWFPFVAKFSRAETRKNRRTYRLTAVPGVLIEASASSS